jgi:hypothetical protein
MLNFILLIFFTFTCSLTSLVYSYDQERAIANLASDFATCSAYYIIASEGLIRTGEINLADQAKQASEKAYDHAVRLSNQKVTEARITLSYEEQGKEMDNNYSYFSILILKYGQSCKDILESPEKRLKYWLEKRD